jgi:hypothetical protein
MRRLPYDVQRDMSVYRTFVEFRNAVERMMIRRGRPLDLDHVWWGFPQTGGQPGEGPGLAGSRVPRRPYGGSGGARVELDEPDVEAAALTDRA